MQLKNSEKKNKREQKKIFEVLIAEDFPILMRHQTRDLGSLENI